MLKDDGFLFTQMASSGLTLMTALLVMFMILLTFGRDKIQRPRLFGYAALAFASAIVVPILGLLLLQFI